MACVYYEVIINALKEIKMDLIKVAEQAFATNKQHPQFFPGDTITVAYRIKEGNKERIQQYPGVVIKINGEGDARVSVYRQHRYQQAW